MNKEEILKNIKNFTNNDEIIAALKILKNAGNLNDLTHIMPFLKHKNPTIKKTAVETIIHIIREKLISDFNELNKNIKTKLAKLLDSLHPSIIDELTKDLFSNDEYRKMRTIQILAFLRKNERIKTVLAKLITDRNEKIRATAIQVMGKMIAPGDYTVLLNLLKDKDNRVRANTIEALENLKNPNLIPLLKRFRKDINNRVRGNVLKALYVLGEKNIYNDIMEMLNSQNNFMIASALWVISQTGVFNDQIIEKVAFFSISDNDMIKRNAVNALNKIENPKAAIFATYLEDL